MNKARGWHDEATWRLFVGEFMANLVKCKYAARLSDGVETDHAQSWAHRCAASPSVTQISARAADVCSLRPLRPGSQHSLSLWHGRQTPSLKQEHILPDSVQIGMLLW